MPCRHELADAERGAIEPPLPGRNGDPGRHGFASNPGVSLALDDGVSPASVKVNAANQTISAAVKLAGGSTATAAAGTLSLAGPVSGTGPVTVAAKSLLILGPTGVLGVPLVTSGRVLLSPQTGGSTIPTARFPRSP